MTLRYAYGMAHAANAARWWRSIARVRAAQAPASAPGRAWLPRADFGAQPAWVARELAWDAYLLRSASVYEEVCRAPHDHPGRLLPVRLGSTSASAAGCTTCCRWCTPIPGWRARSCATRCRCSREHGGQLPYGIGPLCTALNLGTSGDLDFWLLLAAARVRARLARHRVLQRAGAVLRLAPSGRACGSTSSSRTSTRRPCSARTAAIWPAARRLVRLQHDIPADDGVDARDGAARLRLPVARPSWPIFSATGGSRRSCGGAARDLADVRARMDRRRLVLARLCRRRQIGSGAIFEEPQPWAILAGAPQPGRRDQAGAQHPPLPRRRRRTGRRCTARRASDRAQPGARRSGRDGAQSPPGAASATTTPNYVGGVWFDVNGWLTWALGSSTASSPARAAGVERVHAQHAGDPCDGVPRSLGGDDLGRRHLLRLLRRRPAQCGNEL